MPTFTSEIMTASVIARTAAQSVWDFLSSEAAQRFYKQVITVVIVLVAIAAMGIWEGLKQVVFPSLVIACRWGSDRAVEGWDSFRRWLLQLMVEAEGFVAIVMEGAIGL